MATVLDLLQERGYSALRIDDVAARSTVAKTTIYRRWPSLSHLVVAAMQSLIQQPDVPSTTDSYVDLHRLCVAMLESITANGATVAQLAVHIHAQEDPELRDHYRNSLIDPKRQTLIDALNRAQQDGHLVAHTDASIAADMLIGMALYRILILHDPPTEVDAANALQALIER